jgi:uncharacterized protein YcfL
MKTPFLSLIAMGAVLFAGCVTEGPYVPVEKNPSTEIQNTSVILDREIADMIAVDLAEASRTPQGKLLAQANIRNRTNQDLRIQFQIVYRDAQGFSVNDDSAWETMTITANETRGVSVSSMTKKAERFTLRIRMMR